MQLLLSLTFPPDAINFLLSCTIFSVVRGSTGDDGGALRHPLCGAKNYYV